MTKLPAQSRIKLAGGRLAAAGSDICIQSLVRRISVQKSQSTETAKALTVLVLRTFGLANQKRSIELIVVFGNQRPIIICLRRPATPAQFPHSPVPDDRCRLVPGSGDDEHRRRWPVLVILIPRHRAVPSHKSPPNGQLRIDFAASCKSRRFCVIRTQRRYLDIWSPILARQVVSAALRSLPSAALKNSIAST